MKKKIKILLAITTSFLLVNFFCKELFSDNSPYLNPLFGKKIKSFQKEIAQFFDLIIKRKEKKENKYQNLFTINQNFLDLGKEIEEIALKKTTLGVYAGENKEKNIFYVKLSQDLKFEKKTTINLPDGKIITIYSPYLPPTK